MLDFFGSLCMVVGAVVIGCWGGLIIGLPIVWLLGLL